MGGLDDAARDFVAIFERLGIEYAIMGGLAVRLYALPRPTFDVDFTAAVARDRLPEVFQAAEEVGFTIPASTTTGWLDTIHGLPVIKFQWLQNSHSIDIDVFLVETAFQREVLARKQRHGADGWDAWFVSAEDLVLLKLLANRPKDRTDVLDILFIHGQVDEEYLRTWAKALGVADALEAALHQPRE